MAKKSLINRIRKKQAESFIGRTAYIESFTKNLDLTEPDVIFNIYGQGGVGKSFLSQKYLRIAQENKCLTLYTDESIKNLLDWMEDISTQLSRQGIELKEFDKRYKTYLQETKKLEADPEKPKGVLKGLTKTITKGLIKEGKKWVPGGELVGEMINEDMLSSFASEWADFARKKITNKDEVELVLEPIKVLSPLFWKGVYECSEKYKFIVFFIDTFEETDSYMEQWLLDVLTGNHGDDIPENTLLVIAGRDQLNPNRWSEFNSLIQQIPLEPFSQEECHQYLVTNGITEEAVQKDIIQLSGRLPVLLAWLVETAKTNAHPLEDVSNTAVERFLKWIQDEDKKNIALSLALPRFFNQDTLTQLIDDPKKAAPLFDWILTQPFVKIHGNAWTYHQVVRDQMIRYLRNRSKENWQAFHAKLSIWYKGIQDRLEVSEEKHLNHKEWLKWEQERIYHALCENPDVHIRSTIPLIVKVWYEKGISSLEVWGDTILQAGMDNDDEISKNWGSQINQSILDIEKNMNNSQQILINCFLQENWIENKDHLSFLYLGRGVLLGNDNNHDSAIWAFEKAIELKPASASALNNLGVAYYYQKKFDLAIEYSKKAIEIQPYYPDALNNLGNAYSNQQKYVEAIAAYEKAIKLKPDDASTFNNLGAVYYSQKKYDKAISAYQKALELHPDFSDAFNNLGVAYYFQQKYDKAIVAYQKAIKLKPDFSDVFYNLGVAYYSQKKYDEAIVAYKRAIELQPNYSSAFYNLGHTYSDQQRYDEAIECYQKVIDIKPDSASAFNNLGVAYSNQQKYDKAIESYQKAIELSPDYTDSFYNLGIVYSDQQRYDEAISAYQKAIDLNPDYPSAFYNLGNAYYGHQKYKEAIAAYQKAIELKSDHFFAFYNLGNIYSDQQKYNEAIVAYQQAIDLKPDHPDIYNNLGNAYSVQQKYDKAIEAYEKVIELNPDGYIVFINLGLAYMSQQKYNKAIETYEKVLMLKPDDPYAFNDLGNAYYYQQKYNKAIAAYEKAIKFKVDYPDALNNLGIVYSDQQKYAEAIAAYEKVIELKPNVPDTFNSIGFLYLQMGTLTKAKETLTQAVEKGSQDYANMNLGHVFLALKEEEKAINYYLKSLTAFSNKDQFWDIMKDDFQYLEQYGITDEYYQGILEKIRDGSND
ncbi:MAG: tetratricopeptide repeat protein [Bacteroidia bacterium]